MLTVSIGLQSIDKAHIDAAATIGANQRVAFQTLVFAQVMPCTLAGFFLVLVPGFNELIIVFFVSSSAYSTVTVQIFNSLRNGFTPTMAVGAGAFITASVLVFSLVARFGNLPRLLGADQGTSSCRRNPNGECRRPATQADRRSSGTDRHRHPGRLLR